MDYFLIVIGGGPAGYTAAIDAAQRGKSVAVIERDKVGGTCLNRGCVPTKYLLHNALNYDRLVSGATSAIKLKGKAELDETALYEGKQALTDKLVKGIETLLAANRAELILAEATIIDDHTVSADGRLLTAENILIATGSYPVRLPIEGIELTVNSDEVLQAPVKGESVAVIGGGVIGVEFATFLAAAGKKVTVIEAEERILPMFDKETALQTASVLKRKTALLTGARVRKIARNGDKLTVAYTDKKGEGEVIADTVIVSIGRTAAVRGFGLENTAVGIDRHGIVTDANGYTGVAGIYAAGDVAGKIALAHYAAAMARNAVAVMCGEEPSIRLDIVPSCVYTSPEIASVGLKESDLEDGTYTKGKYLLGGNAKSLIEGSDRGFVKILFDAESGKLVGAQIFGERATDLIGELALAIDKGCTAEDISRVIHAHPTVYEGIAESAEDSIMKAIHVMPRRK